MNLRGLVAVSGRPGLFKLIGQNKAGYILESLDAQKTKIIANIANTKLASLEDITVYGESEDIKLINIFEKMAANTSAIPDSKADGTQLRSYFREIAPDHDEEKVYASDMKKILAWYSLIKDLPLFTEVAPTDAGEEGALKDDKALDKKPKAAPKPVVNAKATTKTSAPAKKASMTSKKGV